jgi:hypothetical protein
MISVVVPTMWRFSPFIDFVKDLIQVDIINEIIIINNDNTRTPADPVLTNPKIQMLDFGGNIFVNPAWNIGVNASKNDIVCILNDDLIFDLRLFYKIENFITPEMGVIGLSEGVVDLGQTPITTGEIVFEPFTGQNCYGFGELMFVHKRNWKDIPSGLNIGFGEVFIFERLLYKGHQNYFISNMLHFHGGSTTQREVPRSEAAVRLLQEQSVYEHIKKTSLLD